MSNLRFSVNCGALFIISRLLDPLEKAIICAVTMQKIVCFLLNIIFSVRFIQFRNQLSGQQSNSWIFFSQFVFFLAPNISLDFVTTR